MAAVALVLAGRVDPLEFVVAELRVAGAVAGEVGVGPLAAVAALVDVAVVVAEDVPPLVCRERQHDNARMALDTTDRQTVQSFSFVVYSTLSCWKTFYLASFSLPLSSWNAHQRCLWPRRCFPPNLPLRLKQEAARRKFEAYTVWAALVQRCQSESEYEQQ